MSKNRECVWCDEFFICDMDNSGSCVMFHTDDPKKQKHHDDIEKAINESKKDVRPWND